MLSSTLPAGCWELDLASGTLQLCPHSRRMFGLDPDASGTLTEAQWADRLHPADLTAIQQALAACVDHRVPYAERFRTIQPDGSLQLVFGIGRRVDKQDGRACFVGWNFDPVAAGELAGDWITAHPEALASKHLFSILPLPALASELSSQATSPRALLERAEWILRVRRSREGLFGRAMMGESAFDLLLRLYVRSGQSELSLTSLARPTGIPYSSAMRWIDYLADKGFVARTKSASDRRATSVRLTPEGRAVMDELLAIR
jgi:DNA-binding MarR family transcriptional regulator